MDAPSQPLLDAAYRVIAYLAGRKQLGLSYRATKNDVLFGYFDVNWASDAHANRKNTSGSAAYLYGCLISWGTKLQRCVALSTVEAELVACSEAKQDLGFVLHFLRDLDIAVHPVPRSDSLGCVQVSCDPAHRWRLKHIDTRYHFFRDLAKAGDLKSYMFSQSPILQTSS